MNRETYIKIENNIKYIIVTVYALLLIAFGFIIDHPKDIFYGLIEIIKAPDTLISDYVAIGGIGATFVNSGLLTLLFILLLYKLKINLIGASFAALFTISGFALFGKNIVNVWFIVFGVYLYSRYQRENFSKYIYIALFGTAMAPLTTELFLNFNLPLTVSWFLAFVVGTISGFILPPLATQFVRFHQGCNIYNVGFTAGIIGMVIVSILRSFGYVPTSVRIWSTGNNLTLALFLYSLFVIMFFVGFILNDNTIRNLKKVMKYSGRLVSDYVLLEGFPVTLINMSILGMIATSYILLIGGDLNGPTIGGIFTVVGFGAFGKHPKNILPVLAGVFLAFYLSSFFVDIDTEAAQLAALFGTTLAPIAGEFGIFAGILAGFVHASIVLNVGILHAGTNLYNNGFAGGFVAAVLVPILEALRRGEKNEKQ